MMLMLAAWFDVAVALTAPETATAVARAERFVREQGYTTVAADPKHYESESLEFPSRDDALQMRRGTLQPRAYGVVRRGRGGAPGWTVAFLYSCTEEHLLYAAAEPWRMQSARAVTMTPTFTNLRMEHKEFRLSAVDVVLNRGEACAGLPRVPAGTVAWSTSPDGRYGIMVPAERTEPIRVYKIESGEIVGRIFVRIADQPRDRSAIRARWFEDSQSCLWQIDGTDVLMLLRVGATRLGQLDIRRILVDRIEREVRRRHPKELVAARAIGHVDSLSFDSRLTITVRPKPGPLSLPLELAVEVTSDPQNLPNYPAAARISGKLTATLGTDGSVTTGPFEDTPMATTSP